MNKPSYLNRQLKSIDLYLLLESSLLISKLLTRAAEHSVTQKTHCLSLPGEEGQSFFL